MVVSLRALGSTICLGWPPDIELAHCSSMHLMAACKMILIACFLLGSLLAYVLVTIIYRLYIHPLSRFPGPRLAAMTSLYEIYCAASFDDEIDRMHQEYGEDIPELYVNDSLLTEFGRSRCPHYT